MTDESGRSRRARMRNPFDGGVSRRRMLQSSAAAGATAATAGCFGEDDGDRPTVYVFNTGDRTLSAIDAEADELLATTFIGATASFPSNQYTPDLVTDENGVLWLNVEGGVLGVNARSLETVTEIETGFGPNYPIVTAGGEHLLIAAGGTTSMDADPDEVEDHLVLRVDADPDSDSFGEVTGEIARGYAGPCDMTSGPDGEYVFVTDIADDVLAVFRTDPFEVAAEVEVEQGIGENPLPFMCTASFDGEFLTVENGEGELGPDAERLGSESVWDISDPENPEELVRLTEDDGLGDGPVTSEIAPDGEAAYVFTPGSEDVTVIDLGALEVSHRIDVGGAALAGSWGPNREKLYVPVQTADEVAVIDHEERERVATVEVSSAPVGATAGWVRPAEDAVGRIRASLASLGITVGEERRTTFCDPGECFCGHGADDHDCGHAEE